MNGLKWLNKHLEEAILVFLLATISCVMMAQIIARTFFNSMTWPEEFSRYCYIWTVFLSLGYTIKKGNMLKVGIVMDLLPQKLRKRIEIIVNVIMLVLFVILLRYSIIYTGKVKSSGQFSPAMHLPMWIMYMSTIIGFALAALRMVQEIISNIRNFNKKAETTLEATIKEAKQEVQATGIAVNDNDGLMGGED
ncbi:MAG TPA: TRAP transporter small permease [Bacillota bacterium]|nr:TRAP transporter small permease [Clostridiaceae bacterium]HNR05281.1 TRAP transporter small permease [Bacillota bacterium]HNT03411.1 TRAP transporter small permease [Bacillota bacterium]HPX68846.1 TRAP transporter small permease [Bacillota bacterium]HQA64969.1 TRAP transporter small permease [Bacillota bacterium]